MALIVGDRVIQIPLEWAPRRGTVVRLEPADELAMIKWDTGVIGWYCEGDLEKECIWLIRDETEGKVAPI